MHIQYIGDPIDSRPNSSHRQSPPLFMVAILCRTLLAICYAGPSQRRWGIALKVFVKIVSPHRRYLEENGLMGEILFVDHFGNAISNIRRERLIQEFGLECLSNAAFKVYVDGQPQRMPFCRTTRSVIRGNSLAYSTRKAVLNWRSSVEMQRSSTEFRRKQNCEFLHNRPKRR